MTIKLVRVAQTLSAGRAIGMHTLIGCAVSALFFGIESKTAPAATAGPPYQSCDEARADGRSSIPYTDPAYRPELDFDNDGLACEPPSKGRRSTR